MYSPNQPVYANPVSTQPQYVQTVGPSEVYGYPGHVQQQPQMYPHGSPYPPQGPQGYYPPPAGMYPPQGPQGIYSTHQGGPPAVMYPPQPQPQPVAVTLPYNVQPGGFFTAVMPDGSACQVQFPPHSQPGDLIYIIPPIHQQQQQQLQPAPILAAEVGLAACCCWLFCCF